MLLFFGTDLQIDCVLLDAAPKEDNASSFEDVAVDVSMFMLSLLDDPVAEATLYTLDAVGDRSVKEDNASSFEDVALDGPMFMLSLLDDPVAEETLCTLDAVGDGSVLMPVAVRFLL